MLPPKDLSRKQLRDLRREVQRTVRKLDKSYPNEAKSEEILRAHRLRIVVLLKQGRTIKLPVPTRGQQWERPYPLKPLTGWEVFWLFVFAVVFLATIVGLAWLLHWLGAVTGW
jgi:hypothetical protein